MNLAQQFALADLLSELPDDFRDVLAAALNGYIDDGVVDPGVPDREKHDRIAQDMLDACTLVEGL